MKTKIATIAAALALTTSSAAFAIGGNIDSGIVNFSGKVNGASCIVMVNNDYLNGRVNLDEVEITELNKNSLVKVKPVTIEVSGCSQTVLDNLSVKWTDGALASGNGNEGRLENRGGEATGVYLALSLDGTHDNVVNVGDDAQNTFNVKSDNGVTTFPYQVGYVLGNEIDNGNEVNPGYIFSYATYQVDYK